MNGTLIVKVYADTIAQPVEGAIVEITGNNINERVRTNVLGETDEISLPTPDISISLDPNSTEKPYYNYNIRVTKETLSPVFIENVEIFPQETSIQNVYLSSLEGGKEEVIVLPEHGLYADEDPKIPEAGLKDLEELTRVLPNVLIPEYIIVHDGIPTNTNAANYTVQFAEYIKNVASSEIYSTWPLETIKANVIAIISFTLNRVFTEWYRSRGYNYTITSSPAYDQKYTHGRTIFKSISDVVDQIFNYYIKLPNVTQPLLSQYYAGNSTTRQGWLSQWGSKSLGDSGYSAEEILKHYYSSNISIQTAEDIQGLPMSYPGYTLTIGSCGEEVQKIQNELNVIRGNYPLIPAIPNADGNYKEATRNSVSVFQSVFSLPVTGQVDYATWYKISYIYTAVKRMIDGVYG